jgi:hypothetical protein
LASPTFGDPFTGRGLLCCPVIKCQPRFPQQGGGVTAARIGRLRSAGTKGLLAAQLPARSALRLLTICAETNELVWAAHGAFVLRKVHPDLHYRSSP